MIKRILVPTDGSEVSMQGARYAIQLAKLLKAEISGLFVVDIRLLEGPFLRDLSASLGTAPFVNYQDNISALLQERAEKALGILSDLCKADGVECEAEQITGVVHRCILEKSALSDLVVMGRSGEHSDWLDGLMGSTTEAVLRRINMPVIVTAIPKVETTHFVLAYDGSANASHALKSGVTLCQSLGAPLHVLLVGKPETCMETQSKAQEYLEPHDVQVEYITRSGDAADEIVRYAKESGASLIIMGAYGHTRVRQFILGSVTSQVLNQAPCPVLLQN